MMIEMICCLETRTLTLVDRFNRWSACPTPTPTLREQQIRSVTVTLQ
jgi:hypothetical protein